MEIKKIWNGKKSGFLAAVFMLLSLSVNRLYGAVYNKVVTSNFKKCGAEVKIYPGITIRYPGNIVMGSNVSVDSGTLFKAEFNDGTLDIGDNCTIGRDVLMDFSGGLCLKDNVMISEGVVLQTHDHGYDPKSIPTKRPLMIENNVWVATKAIILASVDSIGENSIIAAGAIVTRDVPKNSIVGGNPARVIREI